SFDTAFSSWLGIWRRRRSPALFARCRADVNVMRQFGDTSETSIRAELWLAKTGSGFRADWNATSTSGLSIEADMREAAFGIVTLPTFRQLEHLVRLADTVTSGARRRRPMSRSQP